MNYIKSLFFNFLVIFFANHVLPGVSVSELTKLPYIQADLFFPFALGFLNSLIYPALRLLDQRVSWFRIAALAFILNFIAYAVLKILPIGIQIVTLEGYLFVAIVVSLGSFILNYLEMKHCQSNKNNESGMPQ